MRMRTSAVGLGFNWSQRGHLTEKRVADFIVRAQQTFEARYIRSVHRNNIVPPRIQGRSEVIEILSETGR